MAKDLDTSPVAFREWLRSSRIQLALVVALGCVVLTWLTLITYWWLLGAGAGSAWARLAVAWSIGAIALALLLRHAWHIIRPPLR